MRSVCRSLGHVFVVVTSAKSNDITNIFDKFILVQKSNQICSRDMHMPSNEP